jgi:cytochrome P450
MTECPAAGRVHVTPPLAAPLPAKAPLPFFQYVRKVRDNALAGWHDAVFHERIVEIKHWRIHTFVVNDPAGIKHVLVDHAGNYVKGSIEPHIRRTGLGNGFAESNSEEWQQRHRVMQSSLDFRSILEKSTVITDVARGVLERWNALPPGEVIAVPEEMAAMTGEIICRIVFSSESCQFGRTLERLFGRYQRETNLDLLDLVPLLDLPWRYVKGRARPPALKYLNESIDRVIAKRMKQGASSDHDFLDRLLRVRDGHTGGGLSVGEIRSQILTVLGSGHDTVALALMWIWYLLAQHPLAESKLHAELDATLSGRAAGTGDLGKLNYTRMVIEEALRLYPPIHTLAWRGALKDDEICGVRIPKGSTVSIVPWVLHRHSKLWDDRDRFDPERFSLERSRERSRYAYLPFGVGPRVCVAASFAMTELTLILATLAQHYRLRLAPGHKVEPQGLISLRARHGFSAALERRHSGL